MEGSNAVATSPILYAWYFSTNLKGISPDKISATVIGAKEIAIEKIDSTVNALQWANRL